MSAMNTNRTPDLNIFNAIEPHTHVVQVEALRNVLPSVDDAPAPSNYCLVCYHTLRGRKTKSFLNSDYCKTHAHVGLSLGAVQHEFTAAYAAGNATGDPAEGVAVMMGQLYRLFQVGLWTQHVSRSDE
jgi:hypothetical protein